MTGESSLNHFPRDPPLGTRLARSIRNLDALALSTWPSSVVHPVWGFGGCVVKPKSGS